MENRVGDVENRLALIQKGYERWGRITFWILAGMAIVLIVNALGGIYVVQQNHDRINEIQQSRIDAAMTQCKDQNFRRKRTIKQLDELLKKRSVGADRATLARLKTSRASTILLINALAPHRDCPELIRERFFKSS